jgi:cyclin-dependent kinase
VHSDSKLYLVMEFLDMDLKKYMDSVGDRDGLGPAMVKVSYFFGAVDAGPD